LTNSTLISGSPGRIVRVCVTVAGSTVGTAYNAPNTASVTPSNVLYIIPNTVGVYDIGAHFSNGLVISPGTGQSVNVTYSLD